MTRGIGNALPLRVCIAAATGKRGWQRPRRAHRPAQHSPRGLHLRRRHEVAQHDEAIAMESILFGVSQGSQRCLLRSSIVSGFQRRHDTLQALLANANASMSQGNDHATATSLYDDGRHYDLQFEESLHDVDFYIDCAHRFGGPILELACGTGRLTIPLARAGFTVCGLDLSPTMLAEAQRKSHGLAPAPRWLSGDMRDFALGERFGLIIIAFNSIAHLYTRDDAERCLAAVRQHLAADGRFVLAFLNPRIDLLARRADDVREVARYPDPDTGGDVVVTETARYDNATQMNHVLWRYTTGREAVTRSLAMRIWFPEELTSLLHYNGFAVESRYGAFDRRAFGPGSPHQVIVATVRNSRRVPESVGAIVVAQSSPPPTALQGQRREGQNQSADACDHSRP